MSKCHKYGVTVVNNCLLIGLTADKRWKVNKSATLLDIMELQIITHEGGNVEVLECVSASC